MKSIILIVGVITVSLTYSFGQSTLKIGTTTVAVDTILSGLDIPWEIKYTKDSYLWFTERRGRVSRVNIASKSKELLLDITSSVLQSAESGLLGFVFHPDFPNQPYIYLAYTYSQNGIKERFVRYTFDGKNLVNPLTLIENIQGNSTHIGCRFWVMPDSTIIASTGDAQNLSSPQDTKSLSGKILRFKFDGSPIDSPPFSQNPLVYSYGHRNVQGLVALPNGAILMSEHGASTDDELNLLVKGGNYGWPNVEGYCDTPGEKTFCNANNIIEPIQAYTPTIAPSDMVYYTNSKFPEWDSCVLMTVLKDKNLYVYKMNAAFDSITKADIYLANKFGRLRDIEIGKDGELFLATNGPTWSNTNPNTHSIIRLRPLDPVAVNELPLNDILIYPYLSTGKLFLKNELSEGQNSSYIIYNSLGQQMLKGRLEKEISIESLQDGQYFISIFYEGSILTTKAFVLKR